MKTTELKKLRRDWELQVMGALRRQGVDDAIIGRVFGVSRQRVGQKLGPKSVTPPEDLSENQELKIYLLEGKPITWIKAETGWGYDRIEKAARAMGFGARKRARLRYQQRWQEVKEGLQQAHQEGWPITEVYIQRRDSELTKAGQVSHLASRAAVLQSFEDWRRELGLDDSALHQQLRKK